MSDNNQKETHNPNPDNPLLLGKKSKRMIYAITSGITLIVIIVVAVAVASFNPLFIPQNTNNSLLSGINYSIGEKMVYNITNTVTSQMSSLSNNAVINPTSYSYNSTGAYEVISFDGETYTLKLTTKAILQGKDFSSRPVTIKVNKSEYYEDFLPSGTPPFFNNISSNPTLSAYIAKAQFNVGEEWNLPVSSGNSSLGLSGRLTIKFAEITEITVPAGTYKVLRIEVSSSNIEAYGDPAYLNSIHISLPENMSLQISGNTYLEQGTYRVIKSELTQTVSQQNMINNIYTEKILVEHIKP